MNSQDPQPVLRTSADITADRLDALRDLIPEAFTEDRIDWDKLRAALGDIVDKRPERYSFTWAGKRDAIRLLQTPTAATLVPAKDESLDWDTTQHLFIEGDNLEVLKLLYKAYYGRVKMIYIDPPYNTGNDFIYRDNYADPLAPYLQLTGQMDAEGTLLASNPETSGRYHSAWLSMMHPRLFIARQLLREDGVILVTIDNSEVSNLRMVMNEIFGEENFVDCVIWQKKVSPSNDARFFSSDHDYVVIYAKSKAIWRPYRLQRTEQQRAYYQNPDNDLRGDWNSATYTSNKSRQQRPNLYYSILNPNTGQEVWPKENVTWKYSREQHQRHVDDDLIYWGIDGTATMPRLKLFLSEAGNVVPRSVWPYSEVGHTQEAMQELRRYVPNARFETPKPSRLIKRMLEISTSPDSPQIVLDFFAGSCATGHAVLDMNAEDEGRRSYILVQLPEPIDSRKYPTLADIGKERLRGVIAQMKAGTTGKLDLSTRYTPQDLGFRVFKLAPSHFPGWTGTAQPTPDEYIDQLQLFAEPLHSPWDPETVVWEIATKEGFSLSSRVETAAVAGHVVYRVSDTDRAQSFHACLDDQVNADIVVALKLNSEDLFICRDAALDDTTAANLALQCRLKTI